MHNIVKYLKKNAARRVFLSFLFITILGFLLRIFTVLHNDIFTDEVFYTQVSRMNSFMSIVQGNNWLKDHGMLYLLFLKAMQYITTDILLLRFVNLILFLIASFVLFKFFYKIKESYTALVPIFMFSFLPYFVYINSYISPYNFVMFFSILAFISISNVILFSTTKRDFFKNSISFLIFSALAFYSDYSIVYFYLSLIPIIFFVYIKNEKKAEDLTFIGFINLSLIIPGLYELVKNFKFFYTLNGRPEVLDRNIVLFINNFSNTIFLKSMNNFSTLIFFIFIVLLFFVYIRIKNYELRYLSFFCLFSLILNTFFLFLFNSFYFSIFVERIFWYFNLILIIGVYCLAIYLNKLKKIVFIIFVVIFVAAKFYALKDSPPIIGGMNIHYKDFVSKLVMEDNKETPVAIIDEDRNDLGVPLTLYYFPGLNVLDKEAENTKKYFSSISIYYLRQFSDVKLLLPNYDKVNFVIFDNNYLAFEKKVNTFSKTNKLNIKTNYFRLECKKNNCFLLSSK